MAQDCRVLLTRFHFVLHPSRFDPTNRGTASWSSNQHQGGGMPKHEEALLLTQQGELLWRHSL